MDKQGAIITKQWQLQDAQDHFTTVFEEALHSGPQIITHSESETVILLSLYEYRKLATPQADLVDFFRNSPLFGVELDLERDKETGRKVEL